MMTTEEQMCWNELRKMAKRGLVTLTKVDGQWMTAITEKGKRELDRLDRIV